MQDTRSRRRDGVAVHSGFTLLEVMIVVLIIGVLASLAVPVFLSAREKSRTKACVANLYEINSAKLQYAMDNKVPANGTVPGGLSTLTGSTGYIRNATVVCPENGTYNLNNVSTNPSCTIGETGAGAYAAGGDYYHGLP